MQLPNPVAEIEQTGVRSSWGPRSAGRLRSPWRGSELYIFTAHAGHILSAAPYLLLLLFVRSCTCSATEGTVTSAASTTAISSNSIGRKRAAELTSGIGALVLGLGLGVAFGERLAGLGVWALVIGALVHGWGMYDKHRASSGAPGPRIRGGPPFSTGCAGCCSR